jgi:hypothetical protein
MTIVQLSVGCNNRWLGWEGERVGTATVGVSCGLGMIAVDRTLCFWSAIYCPVGSFLVCYAPQFPSSPFVLAREASRLEAPHTADPAPAAGPRLSGGAGVGGLPLPGTTPPQSSHTIRMVWEYIELVVLFCRKTQNVRARACCAF